MLNSYFWYLKVSVYTQNGDILSYLHDNTGSNIAYLSIDSNAMKYKFQDYLDALHTV